MFRTLAATVLVLFFAAAAGAADSETDATHLDANPAPVLVQALETSAVAPAEAEDSEINFTPAPAGSCTDSETDAAASMQLMGFFGPHCTRPFNCNYSEPGLGFDCLCHYSCECATCNGNFVRINCVLVENDGCFACPTYDEP